MDGLLWGSLKVIKVQIENSFFSMLNNTGGVIQLDGTFLTLQGPLIFTKIVSDSAIVYVGSSSITLANQITFSGNQAKYCHRCFSCGRIHVT